MKVFKYTLANARGRYRFGVPGHGQIRHVGPDPSPTDHGSPAIWIEVDEDAEEQDRFFTIFPTGGAIPGGHWWVGTAICGRYVWHIYESLE